MKLKSLMTVSTTILMLGVRYFYSIRYELDSLLRRFSFNTVELKTFLLFNQWRLKEANLNPDITWRVVETSKAFTPELKKCHCHIQIKKL